ncbi:MAG: hypothetical protein ACKKMW_02070 [Candidatus Nealsonbacteria bacterium]
MKNLICNKHTYRLAQQNLLLSLKKTYLDIQYALLIAEVKGEKRERFNKFIKETGQNYLSAKDYLINSIKNAC